MLETSGKRPSALLAVLCIGLGSAWGAEYPAPRFPDFPAVSDEELLDKARVVVKRAGGNRNIPGYDIKPGERALLTVTPFYDSRIVNAIASAIREAGAAADTFIGDVADIVGSASGIRAWGDLENPIFLFMHTGARHMERMLGGGLTVAETLDLTAFKDYDILIAGFGGPKPRTAFRWEEIPWYSADEFLASMAFGIPGEVYEKIDETAWAQFRQARYVRVTDPEGTDMSWRVPAEIGRIDTPPRYWHEWLCMPGFLRNEGTQSADDYRATDLGGVIAGTINHVGAFPRIEVVVEDGGIRRIEGGGRFGDEWRKVLEKYAGTRWPHHPGPGFHWVQECAIGIVPEALRPRDAMRFPFGTVRERRRSGIFHWAFGVQNLNVLKPDIQEQIHALGLPDGHFDVHNNFPTMTIETTAGKTLIFIDKGRLTALDDPEVRRLAAEYGDPDQLLREVWVPPVPGINVAGDYFNDYANDPVSWIAHEYERFFSNR